MTTVREIQSVVAESFGVPRAKMVEPLNRGRDTRKGRNAREFSRPRMVAMYLAKEMTGHSYPRIGMFFGNRDHSTVIHAVRTVECRLGKNDCLATKVAELRDRLSVQSGDNPASDAFLLNAESA